MSSSELVQRGLPCDSCGSSDANALYSDGHSHCHKCGAHKRSPDHPLAAPTQTSRAPAGLLSGSPQTIKVRGLTEDTCSRWGYLIGTDKGQAVQLASYRSPSGGPVVAQKVRGRDKQFRWVGDPKAVGLYGQWLWKEGGKKVVVTEGEIDALSVSQIQQHKWPVVSVPNGAQGAARDLKRQLKWLESFDEVILMFDMDEPGREAAQECAALFSPGKCSIAELPLKDANEMLKAGRGSEVVSAIFNAREWRPDGILSIDEIKSKAMEPPQWGLSWPWPTITKLTYGIRRRECYAIGAGVGVGKTDLMTQLAAHLITEHQQKIGMFFLEQAPVETAIRLAGKVCKKPLHLPDGDWTPQDKQVALDALKGSVWFYDHFGSTEWETIRRYIRWMVKAEGISVIFLDHLTALTSHAEDERRCLDKIMADLAGDAQSLDITIFFVSHLTTPSQGPSHEEGGRVMEKHFTGSRAIARWSHFMFGMERNKQAEDEAERSTTRFRILKDRNTGQSTGHVVPLSYNPTTGIISEAEGCSFESPDEPPEF